MSKRERLTWLELRNGWMSKRERLNLAEDLERFDE